MLKKIDSYIIRKVLSTFSFLIIIFFVIGIAIDLSEKMDDFMESSAPWSAIIIDYYALFFPTLLNMLSGFFTFLSVTFVTSRMAYRSEIIAILSNGMSFSRMMRPFLLCGLLISLISWSMYNFILPVFQHRLNHFKVNYLGEKNSHLLTNFHRQVAPGVFFYMKNYNSLKKTGNHMTLEKMEGGLPIKKLTAKTITWDTIAHTWQLTDWMQREFTDDKLTITSGRKMDTAISILPKEMTINIFDAEQMNIIELNKLIDRQEKRGFDQLDELLVNKHKRQALPFASLILASIGVCIAFRRSRGGTGMHLGFGLILTFLYLFLLQTFEVLAKNGTGHPGWMLWFPNILYVGVALVFYLKSKK